jgi:hypothetical protein
MEKEANNYLNELIPYFISITIHTIIFTFIFLLSHVKSIFFYETSVSPPAPEITIESIDISQESTSVIYGEGRDAVLQGLNDSVGRELWKCARSGISVTPENFLEYIKIRGLRKSLRGLDAKTKVDIFKKYPFLTGTDQFQSGIGQKIISDFHESYQDVCRMINFNKKDRASEDDEPDKFISAVMDYLNGQRPVRTWRTFWMVPESPTRQDKIVLVILLRRLNNFCIEGENVGYEHMCGSVKALQNLIPDKLKYPEQYDK